MNRVKIISALLVVLGLSGCYPKGAEYADDLDLVATIKGNDVDYDKYQTYFLADTVMFVKDNESDVLRPGLQDLILNQIASNMNAYGWTRISNPAIDTGAALITATVINTTQVVSGGWWGYWGGWWGGYYPPGGGYYPGYPGGCCYTYYEYTTGSLVVDMIDPSDSGNGGPGLQPLPLLWGGVANGLVTGSDQSINIRVQKGINQMFWDSPYLDKN